MSRGRKDLERELKRAEARVEAIKNAITALDAVGKYGGMTPLAATEKFLEARGIPASRDEICTELIDGGAYPDYEISEANRLIMISIGRSLKEGRLREQGKKIGLPSWPENRWPLA
jgi:hypothetical protein